MKNVIYIYPDRSFSPVPDANPYRGNMEKGFIENGNFVIKSKSAWLGTLDILLHLHQIDVLVCNWIEEVANRKFGYIQAFGLLISIPLLKLFSIQIVWIIHNKKSHNSKNKFITDFFRNMLFNKADKIIAHAESGLEGFGDNIKKINYYPHPLNSVKKLITSKDNFLYDILIWGKIQPYKGILEFLSYLKANDIENNYSILVQGDCPNNEYFRKVKDFSSNKIKIVNKYTSSEELDTLIKETKIILFTHKEESVLSSGALLESLRYGKTIIGPNIGNFKDLYEKNNLLKTYTSYKELIYHINTLLNSEAIYQKNHNIEEYANTYTWKAFTNYIIESIN